MKQIVQLDVYLTRCSVVHRFVAVTNMNKSAIKETSVSKHERCLNEGHNLPLTVFYFSTTQKLNITYTLWVSGKYTFTVGAYFKCLLHDGCMFLMFAAGLVHVLNVCCSVGAWFVCCVVGACFKCLLYGGTACP